MADKRLEARVGEVLLAKGWTVCAAESCTGGLVLHRLTNIPGSSAYVLGGVVAYSNAVKQSVLKVRQGTLIAYGAVSEPTAIEMAQGVRALTGADVAVSITGIAGPGGGTPEKPVGTVVVAVVSNDDRRVRTFRFFGDREQVKFQASQAALDMVRRMLQG